MFTVTGAKRTASISALVAGCAATGYAWQNEMSEVPRPAARAAAPLDCC